jgi:hypothetical protein
MLLTAGAWRTLKRSARTIGLPVFSAGPMLFLRGLFVGSIDPGQAPGHPRGLERRALLSHLVVVT